MDPIKFPQVNKTLGKPQGMTDEECGSLPIYNDGQYCTSLWQMSWRERLSALFFGKVWLHVLSGVTQPPVSLEVKRTIFQPVRKLNIRWTCSNDVHHEHKTKISAWLCGRFQFIQKVKE